MEENPSGNGQQGKWTPKAFDDLLTGAFSEAGWFKMHRALILKWGLEAAAVLSYLINYHSRVKRSATYKWNSGWFYCTIEKLEEELGLPRKAQDRAIAKLKSAGALGTQLIGLPARRHFRIDPRVVLNVISEWESGQSGTNKVVPNGTNWSVPNGTTIVPSNIVPSNIPPDTNVSGGTRGRRGRPRGTPGGFLASAADKEVGGELYLMLESSGSDLLVTARDKEGRVKRRAAGLPSFHRVVSRLRLERKVPEEELRAVAAWLKQHYDDPKAFVPRVRAVDDLFDKWGQFREAMRRWEADDGAEQEAPRFSKEYRAACFRLRDKMAEYMRERGRNPFADRWERLDYARACEELGLPQGTVRDLDDLDRCAWS